MLLHAKVCFSCDFSARRSPHAWLRACVLQGVANRGASIRVGRDTEKEGKGYFEDRRPASNMDPYVVTGMIAETTILWKGN
jgi:glutamine synthetase